MTLLDELTTEMRHEHRKWAPSTRVYGTLDPTLRVFLIVTAAVVSAESRR